ncbi:MAG: 2-C-methyl-D-erythritol 4-phosphate cytidylyltransferase [Dehalococcoidia bacterium]
MPEPIAPLPQNRRVSIGAVVLAAGLSQRMGGIDKPFALLRGRPLILHSLDVFQSCSHISQIVLVLAESSIDKAQKLVGEMVYSKSVSICPGGPRRQDSARNGLSALNECQWVVIHDGARPCIDLELLNGGICQAFEHGSAVAAVPVADTIKVADDQGYVVDTPPRRELWAVQTPQIFRFSELKRAYEQIDDDVTDDATLVERSGGKVKLYQGSPENIKVTTPHDLSIAEMILSKRDQAQ